MEYSKLGKPVFEITPRKNAHLVNDRSGKKESSKKFLISSDSDALDSWAKLTGCGGNVNREKTVMLAAFPVGIYCVFSLFYEAEVTKY